MRDTEANGGDTKLPLRERLPEYVVVFAVGLATAGAIGLLIGTVSSVAVASAVGYAIVLLGVAWLWAGGAFGSGYSSLGLGEGVIRRTFAQGIGGEPGHRADRHRAAGVDPVERIREGMRPDANPRAFWQVVGGVLYIGIGLAVVILA